MKRLFLLFALVISGIAASAQFPSTDSLAKFINRYIRNSPVEAFQNLRLNTALIGLVNWIDSARLGQGASIGIDSVVALNDSTLRFRKNGVYSDVVVAGNTALLNNKLDSIHIYTASDPDPDTIYSYKSADSSLVGLIPKGGGGVTTDATLTGDGTEGDPLKVDTSVIATIDSVYAILVRSVVVVDTIQFIHSGSGSSTYQNDKLINSKLLSLSLENYPVGFIERSTSVWMTFDPETGTITLTNGEFADEDLVTILYRTGAIFLVDGMGNLVIGSNGYFVITN